MPSALAPQFVMSAMAESPDALAGAWPQGADGFENEKALQVEGSG